MTAQTLPNDDTVLTQEQIDAYIDYQVARLAWLLAARNRVA